MFAHSVLLYVEIPLKAPLSSLFIAPTVCTVKLSEMEFTLRSNYFEAAGDFREADGGEGWLCLGSLE